MAARTRCDFLTLMFKNKRTQLVSSLSGSKAREIDRALAYALQLDR